ncbi:MAG: hypothetical protein ABFS24_12850 [Pseudomonadota bacterium]
MRTAAGPGVFADIRFPAVVLSLLISAWFAYTAGLINNDGIHYLSAARLIAAGDWAGACQMEVLRCWLLFPSLIATVGKLTGLGLESAAYLLGAVFSGLMVFAFLTLVRELGANRTTLVIAAFVILLHPFLNNARADVIRDHGYWALYLLMVLFFIRFWRDASWQHAFAWMAAAVAATLFRIEGIVFLLFLPLVLVADTSRRFAERLLRLLKAHAFTGLVMLMLLAWWALDPAFSAGNSGRLFEPVQRLAETREQLHTGLEIRAQVMGEQVLGSELDHYALSALWAGLLMIIVYKVINTLSPLYALLFFFRQLRAHFSPPAGVVPVIAWLVVLNLSILLVEVLTRFTLSGRFAVPLALTLMLIVPFLLEAMYSRWQAGALRGWQRWLALPLVLAALLFMAVDGFYSSGSGRHDYLRDAGYWLRDRVDSTTRVFSNNARVIHYSGQDSKRDKWVNDKRTSRMLKRGSWRKYDYIAIQVDGDDKSLRDKAVKALGMPVMEFSNSYQDSVLVFETAVLAP